MIWDDIGVIMTSLSWHRKLASFVGLQNWSFLNWPHHYYLMGYGLPMDSPHKGPVTQGFNIFFGVRMKKWLNKAPIAGDLRHHDVHVTSLWCIYQLILKMAISLWLIEMTFNPVNSLQSNVKPKIKQTLGGIRMNSALTTLPASGVAVLVAITPAGTVMNKLNSEEHGQFHDDVIKWKHFPRYWPFVRGILA